MAIKYINRLHLTLHGAGILVDSVNDNGIVTPTNLQVTAQPIIDAFDDSDAAQAAFLDGQEPLLKDIKDQAAAAIQANDTFLGLSNPNNAQVLQQVQRLTQQNNRLIRALVRVIARTWR